MARVTGIGGVFLRSNDAAALQEWYVQHLGLEPDEDGYIVLNWGGDHSGSTVWAAFDGDAGYFGGPESNWMINYRVDDLNSLVEALQAAGVPVDDQRFEDFNGRFAHCWDPEGNWCPAPQRLPVSDRPATPPAASLLLDERPSAPSSCVLAG